MQPFTTHTGIAVPLIKDDINTDQIAPVQSMRALKPDYKALLFMRARRRDDGSEDPDFVLNQPQFRHPGILVTGHNFGAGSIGVRSTWPGRTFPPVPAVLEVVLEANACSI